MKCAFFLSFDIFISADSKGDNDTGGNDELGCLCCSLSFSSYSWLWGSMTLASTVDLLIQRCKSLAQIKQLQSHFIITSLFGNYPFRTKLLEHCAISSAGDLNYAAEIFRRIDEPQTNDWNAIIRGLAQSDAPQQALSCFLDMLRSYSGRPDALTFSFVLKSCARLLALVEGQQVHAKYLRLGYEADLLLQTTAIDVYAKCGDLDGAQRVFDEMPRKDIPTWNALITGLAQGSRAKAALDLFKRMQAEGLVPNEISYIGALLACAQIGALREGLSIHVTIRAVHLDTTTRVCNALIDMYAKCGSIDRACDVFNQMIQRTLVSWNSIIMGLALHGHAHNAVELFAKMQCSDVRPDSVTYLAALSACNHAGLVDEGLRLFNEMKRSGVICNVKHYGSVVDLLGRAGRLDKALEVITSMPFEPDAVLWQCLLGACKTYRNIGLAELASQKLSELGSSSCGDFVLMSNLYAAHERWDDVGRVREAMKSKDVRKVPGFSYIEVKGVMHRFINGDHTHVHSNEIYAKLDEINFRIQAYGYVPRTLNVLHDICEEEKENALFYHSEKLALAYGLISIEEGESLQVIKNLRICGDCHVVFSHVSKSYGRELIVRDRSRFHRFKQGSCSCGDYW